MTQKDYISYNYLTTLDGSSAADRAPTPLVQECCNPFDQIQVWDKANVANYITGLRATKCLDNQLNAVF